jgi:glycosyltransferase involved in cell wall biosynthesis
MPSRGEGFKIALIGAADFGHPVIGNYASGSREALLDGRLGRLFDPTNQDELSGAVTAVLEAHDCRDVGKIPLRIECISAFSVCKNSTAGCLIGAVNRFRSWPPDRLQKRLVH